MPITVSVLSGGRQSRLQNSGWTVLVVHCVRSRVVTGQS